MMVTATATKTLVVNPAFLQEIKDSNPDLRRTVDRLSEVCQDYDRPFATMKGLTRLLDLLRDQLAIHFSLEESYGFLEVPATMIQHVPRRTRELAVRAQGEHATLYLAITELAERAEELQYRGVQREQFQDLVMGAAEFLHQLQTHEEREQDLIRRSFDLD